MRERVILHCDLNNFYASVECVLHPELKGCQPSLERAVEAIVNAVKGGGKLLLAGSGGSAADCEHIAGELLKEFRIHRRRDPFFDDGSAAWDDVGHGNRLFGKWWRKSRNSSRI